MKVFVFDEVEETVAYKCEVIRRNGHHAIF
jgi:hypothetical protein